MLCLTLSVEAQQYDYSKFRFPNLHIRQLTGTLDLGSNGSYSRYSSSAPITPTKYTYNYWNNEISAFYSDFKNSENLQKYNRYNIDLQTELNTNKVDSLKVANDWNLKTNFQNVGVYRRYSKNNNFKIFGISQPFYEIDRNLTFSIYKKNKYVENYISAIVPLKIGVGRVEPISQIFNAQFLMDDLKKEGLLLANFSEDKLYELAQLMEQVSRKRVFDYRRAFIYQLETLSNWMETNGVPTSAKSFAILNDNWFFNRLNNRNYGKRLSFGVTPYINNGKLENINTIFSNPYFGFSTSLEYSQMKPLNQSIQSNFYVSAEYNNTHYENSPSVNNFTLRGVHEMSYNPNSRSTYSFQLGTAISFIENKQNLGLSGLFSFTHFINYRTYLLGYISSSYFNQNSGGWHLNQNFLSNQTSPFSFPDLPYSDYINTNIERNVLTWNANLKLNVILF